MARQTTDDQIGRDPRFDRMAALVGWSKRELVGCFQLDVWPLCYDRVTPNVPAIDIDTAANRGAVSPVAYPKGFAAAMIKVGLGRKATKEDASFIWIRKGKPELLMSWPDAVWQGRVYVCGAAKRIQYLITSKAAGQEGGVKSGEVRSVEAKGPLRDPQGSTNLILTLTPTLTDTDRLSAGADAFALTPPEVPQTPPGFTEVISAFTSRYEAAYGSKPDWGPMRGKQVKSLLKRHGQLEVLRRMAIMFDSPRAFPPPPYDFGAFVQHFDKFVVSGQPAQAPLRRSEKL